MTKTEIIIRNAKVLSMVPGAKPADCVLIGGGKILAVGNEVDAIFEWEPGVRIIDAGGATVMPGIVEAHMHLFPGAYGRRLLQLFGVAGEDALSGALQSYADANPDEGLLIAKGADYVILGEDRPITRQALDRMVPDRPLILIAPDHHTGWANTVALDRAGILHGRDLPTGNEIVLAEDGTATGELREGAAMGPVMDLRTSGGRENLGLHGTEPGADLTPAQRAEDKEILAEGLRYAASLGITSIHNMDGNRYQLDLLRELEHSGDLLCRTQVPFHLTPSKPLSSLEEASAFDREFRTPMLRSGRVKMFMDGVIDSGTGVMVEDYSDRPGWRGEPLHSQEAFNAAAIDIDRRGLQISVHAIGDGAVNMVLNGYEAARDANGIRDSRHRIEHIEVVHPDDVQRFADMGVVASMQPPHPPGSMGLPLEPYLSRIGSGRWPLAFAWRDFWNAGVPIAFASDWPVSALEPFQGVHAAITRKPWRDDMPDHSATLNEALRDYTATGAYAGFSETDIGSLEPGKKADLIVLSDNLHSLDEDEVSNATVRFTICDGKLTWED